MFVQRELRLKTVLTYHVSLETVAVACSVTMVTLPYNMVQWLWLVTMANLKLVGILAKLLFSFVNLVTSGEH